MLIDTTLLVNSPEIIKGLLDGSMQRYGSVIRWAAGTENAGQIVRHLAETPGITHKLIDETNNVGNAFNYQKLIGIEKTLSSAMGLTQIAAGASVLNLGVSIAGFTYMSYKLHQIQKNLGHLQQSMEAGFNRIEADLNRIEGNIEKGFNKVGASLNRIDNRLNIISGQLSYLYLLVEDNRQKQKSLAKVISHIQQAMIIQEIAALNAEINDRQRFPNESPRECLKVTDRVRLFLSNQALQISPQLDAELILSTDIAIQGWAIATATQANLLLEIDRNQEASVLLAQEVPKFQQVAQTWGNELINDENSYLSTAYRFTNSRFQDYISPERVERIIQIFSSDYSLSPEQIRSKKTGVDVEFEMSHNSQWDEIWINRQVAVAEYLDTLSELSARLDSLQSFAALCESRNINIREMLPDSDAKEGLYVLP